MSIEESVFDIKTFIKKFDGHKFVNLEKKTNKIINYLHEYNDTIRQKLNTALINALKLDEPTWNMLNAKQYCDFFQVRNKITKQLEYTYTLNKWNGLAKRRFCMHSDFRLSINELKEFLNNKEAVNALVKISGYKELIETIRTILDTLFEPNDIRRGTKDYTITFDLTDTEQKIFSTDTGTYDYSDTELTIGDNEYSHESSYHDTSFDFIKRKMVLTTHKDEIIKKSNDKLKIYIKQQKKYRTQEDEIKEKLAKWLMLEMI